TQVDDYPVKPADVESLITTMQEKLLVRASQPAAGPKRLAAILKENSSEITRRMLEAMKRDRKLSGVPLSDEERVDYLLKLLNALIELLERERDEPSAAELRVASEHGKRRKKQGCPIPNVIKDFDLLHQPVYDLIQNNLMGMDVTELISDLKRLQRNLHALLEKSLEVYASDKRSVRSSAVRRGDVLSALSALSFVVLMQGYPS